MTGRHAGFIAQCKKHIDFPSFMHYHCTIQQKTLCSETIGLQHVIVTDIKVINSIRAVPLQNRLFKVLLDEVDAIHEDLILHSRVR